MNANQLERTNTLNGFIAKYSHLPEQGSVEWLNGRKLSFGGSEIAALIGEGFGKTKKATTKNQESQLKKLIAGKVGLDIFKGNMFTRWGNLFERTTEKFTEVLFKTELKFTGSLPGKFVGQKYSPDGLGVVKMTIDGEEKYVIVLFDFKAPFSKIPTGVIPSHYIPQVKTGLLSIDIADIAIFINNTYRKCSLSDFNLTASYNTEFHTFDRAKSRKAAEIKTLSEVKEPTALGFIYFSVNHNKLLESRYYTQVEGVLTSQSTTVRGADYDDIGLFSDSDDESGDSKGEDDGFDPDYELKLQDNLEYILSTKLGYIKSVDDLLDLGDAGKHDTASLLSMLDDGILTAHHSELFMNMDLDTPQARLESFLEDEKKNVQKLFDDEQIFGILPWKLLVSNVIEQKRDHEFADVIEPFITKNCGLLEKITGGSASKHEIYKRFYDRFAGINCTTGLDKAIKENMREFSIMEKPISDDLLSVLD